MAARQPRRGPLAAHEGSPERPARRLVRRKLEARDDHPSPGLTTLATVTLMKMAVSFKGKPAVLELDGRHLTVTNPNGFRQHISDFVDTGSPRMSFDGQVLTWKQWVLEVPAEPAATAEAAKFVAAVDAARAELPGEASPKPRAAVTETASQRACRIAKNVEGFALVLLLAGVVGGILMVFRTDESCSAPYDCSTTHPYVGMGVGLAVAAAFQASIVIMVAAYIQARTSTASGSDPTG